ncbi:hypothetical protein KSP40_PGU000914 [Platanthera guangdongensis]|uniref:Uncharacterized protein n=1 Tax=Platanthera guangdongensis TaxID=2320717 RepID=A0ABR2MC66_9ASPA
MERRAVNCTIRHQSKVAPSRALLRSKHWLSPETLMAEIDAAIASIEYTHATNLLSSIPSSPSPSDTADTKNAMASSSGIGGSSHDARLEEEAYRKACAALISGQPDAAVRSIRVALASCQLYKISVVAKIQSLSSIASAQLQKQKKQNQQHPPHPCLIIATSCFYFLLFVHSYRSVGGFFPNASKSKEGRGGGGGYSPILLNIVLVR